MPAKGCHHSKETLDKMSKAHKGRHLSEKNRKALSLARKKLNEGMCKALAREFVDSGTDLAEILKNYAISSPTFYRYMGEALEKKFITREEYDTALDRRERTRGGCNPPVTFDRISSIAMEYIHSEARVKDLALEHGTSTSTIYNYLKRAVEERIITQEEYDLTRQKKYYPSEETRRNMSKSRKGRQIPEDQRIKISKSHRALNDEKMASLAQDFVGTNKATKELAQEYDLSTISISRYMVRAVKLGLVTRKEYDDAIKKKKMNPSEETRERFAIAAVNREKHKTKKYFVENRFHADSISEGAAALLLERYIPGFKIEHDKTFQENGDTTCLYDFILENAILEWHPIELHNDSSRLSPGEYQAYLWHKANLKKGDMAALAELAHEFKQKLAVEYWFKRQLSSDNSQVFKGKGVFLARDVQELYEFVVKYNKNIPSYVQFKKEFGGLCKYVSQFERKKKESGQTESKLEQKVEVAGVAGA
jgi:transposase-like protein